MAERPSPSSSDAPADDRELNVRRVRDFVQKSLRKSLSAHLGAPNFDVLKNAVTNSLKNIADSMGLGPEGEPPPPPQVRPEMSDDEMVRAVEDTLLYQPPLEQVVVERDPNDATRVLVSVNVRLPYAVQYLTIPLEVK
jgi:hypothetical protein